MTLVPSTATRLRVSEGRLWVTFEAPRRGPAPRNGDHFVTAGRWLDLLPGESAVLEPVGFGASASFRLEPVSLASPWRARTQQALAGWHRAASALRLPSRLPSAGQRPDG